MRVTHRHNNNVHYDDQSMICIKSDSLKRSADIIIPIVYFESILNLVHDEIRITIIISLLSIYFLMLM